MNRKAMIFGAGLVAVGAIVIAYMIGLMNGEKRSTPKAPNTAGYPTATAAEVFAMRSQCAEMGEKILGDGFIGPALRKDELSHYNPLTNRCYVRVIISSADVTLGDTQRTQHDVLYDGQTREMLASVEVNRGKKNWIVYGRPDIDSFEKAIVFVNDLMDDDHKR